MNHLDIYVSAGCPNCRFARGLARRTAEAFPAIRVQVLDIDRVSDPPEAVFATPSYLLDGRLISLGNPDEGELFALLTQYSIATAAK